MSDSTSPESEVEKRLRESRARLLIETVRDYAIFELDPQGRIATWNPGAQRIKGYKAAEIIGKHFSVFYTKEDLDSGKPDRELCIATEEGRVMDEGWRVRKDGSLFWASVVITALRDESGTLVGFAKVTRDLTERRAAEERLRASEERLRTLVDSVGDYAIIVLDRHGRVETWNTGAHKIYQYTVAESVGRPVSIFYPREDAEDGKPQRDLKAAAEAGRFEDESWRLRKDGSRLWASVIISAMRATSGELIGFSQVTRDLTERRFHEESLRQANLAATTSIAELESFSYSVAHDLRAPLRAIAGFSDLLARHCSAGLDEKSRVYLRRILEGSALMGRLIDDLLKLSRVTRGALVRESVDLSALADRIASELHRIEPERRVEFIIARGIVVQGDSSVLRIVLENLMQNAWKYTNRKPSARIEFGAFVRKGERVYFVRDDGAGFDMRFAENLFKPFHRLHKPGEFEGTGIGLATVHRVVRRYGGRVWGEAKVGEGAAFYFTLPERPMTVYRDVILLVEDSPADEELIRIALEENRIANRVEAARDGQEALDYLFGTGEHAGRDTSALPMVMLLDLHLPKVEGLEVLRRVRADDRTKLMPVVILTSSDEQKDRLAGYDLGANSFVRKPVEFGEFSNAIKQLGLYWLLLNLPPGG